MSCFTVITQLWYLKEQTLCANITRKFTVLQGCPQRLFPKTLEENSYFPQFPLIVAYLHGHASDCRQISTIIPKLDCQFNVPDFALFMGLSQRSQPSYYHAVTFKEPYQATWVSQNGHSQLSHQFPPVPTLWRSFTFCFPFPGPASRIPNPKPFPQFQLMSSWQCLRDWITGPSSSPLPLSIPSAL